MKLNVSGIAELEVELEKLGGRDAARRIVEAGCAEAVKQMTAETEAAHHIVTRDMVNSIAPGKYHEDLNSAWQEVYPQGYDRRGISNAKKAFVINWGRGKRRTAKTGDKFITGKKATLEEAVGAAMRAEAERILNELKR